MALISTEQLKNVVKTYLDENDITITSEAPNYSRPQ